MCGIQLAVAVEILIQPIMAVGMPHGDLVAQIMPISALAMHNLSEYAFFDHIQNGHFFLPVAAVFQQHDRALRSLVGAHKLKAFLQRMRTAHLHADGHAGVHAVQRDLRMRAPSGGANDAIHIVSVKKRVILLRAEGGISLLFLHQLLHVFHAVGIQVANCRNLCNRHMIQHHHNQPAASAAHTYKSNSDLFHKFSLFRRASAACLIDFSFDYSTEKCAL